MNDHCQCFWRSGQGFDHVEIDWDLQVAYHGRGPKACRGILYPGSRQFLMTCRYEEASEEKREWIHRS